MSAFLGFLLGLLLALWYLPKQVVTQRERLLSQAKHLKGRVDPSQGIAESMATGKAIAARRQRDDVEA
jgi:hypothetical protein